jgi:hypothetical protein
MALPHPQADLARAWLLAAWRLNLGNSADVV